MPVHDKIEMMEVRKNALGHAQEVLGPVFEKFEPKDYETRQAAGPLATPQTSRYTSAEQVVSLVLDVADWLVEGR